MNRKLVKALQSIFFLSVGLTLLYFAFSGIDLKEEDIPLDDPAVYEMISKGDTDGVFQLESSGMRLFLQNMKPSCP